LHRLASPLQKFPQVAGKKGGQSSGEERLSEGLIR
jgi:hypothetical protein